MAAIAPSTGRVWLSDRGIIAFVVKRYSKRQKAEGRRQKAEGRRQTGALVRTEGRRQKADRSSYEDRRDAY
jgi:hypothetical protein